MANRQISKYESAIHLQRKKAGKATQCYSCKRDIGAEDYYYRQSLGLIREPPGIILHAFCVACSDSSLANRLDTRRELKDYSGTMGAANLDELKVADTNDRDKHVEGQLPLLILEELAQG